MKRLFGTTLTILLMFVTAHLAVAAPIINSEEMITIKSPAHSLQLQATTSSGDQPQSWDIATGFSESTPGIARIVALAGGNSALLTNDGDVRCRPDGTCWICTKINGRCVWQIIS